MTQGGRVELVLLHSALGLNDAVHRFADGLRAEGHVVHTPDLYDGAVFDDLDRGVAERDRIGAPELSRRAITSVEGLPVDIVYVGFSMGARLAQVLATSRPGVRGVVLVQGGAPPDQVGVKAWPSSVPVQVHVAVDDPWFDRQAARRVADSVSSAAVDVHEYAGDAHLFCDPDGAGFDPEATTEMMGALRRWLPQR